MALSHTKEFLMEMDQDGQLQRPSNPGQSRTKNLNSIQSVIKIPLAWEQPTKNIMKWFRMVKSAKIVSFSTSINQQVFQLRSFRFSFLFTVVDSLPEVVKISVQRDWQNKE